VVEEGSGVTVSPGRSAGPSNPLTAPTIVPEPQQPPLIPPTMVPEPQQSIVWRGRLNKFKPGPQELQPVTARRPAANVKEAKRARYM
jgi:hypothetical protein